MQIGLECFLDEQLSSMIASENRHGDCEIQHKTDCIIYDTEEDHYLESCRVRCKGRLFKEFFE